jgi:serine/threonine protein phosphatase PrpC
VQLTISGQRRRYLQLTLGADTRAYAVCSGFGEVDGQPVEEAALRELQSTLQRRSRGARFGYQLARPKAMAGFLIAVLSRVNAYLYQRSAAHEDYVTSGASLTLVLLCKERAYLAHVGTTAAYLVRSGYVVALTKDDSCAFDADGAARILTRALGISSQLQLSVCSFRVMTGDTLVLASKRLAGLEDRRALARWILRGEGSGAFGGHTVAAIPIHFARIAPSVPATRERTRLWYIVAAVLLSILLLLAA